MVRTAYALHDDSSGVDAHGTARIWTYRTRATYVPEDTEEAARRDLLAFAYHDVPADVAAASILSVRRTPTGRWSAMVKRIRLLPCAEEDSSWSTNDTCRVCGRMFDAVQLTERVGYYDLPAHTRPLTEVVDGGLVEDVGIGGGLAVTHPGTPDPVSMGDREMEPLTGAERVLLEALLRRVAEEHATTAAHPGHPDDPAFIARARANVRELGEVYATIADKVRVR